MTENKRICAKCGGKCCKDMPGAAFPEDFNFPEEKDKLIMALKNGNWCIDWWVGDPRENIPEENEVDRAYFVRPSIVGYRGKLFDPTWGGRCIFLTSTGCALNLNERPLNCKMLKPKRNKECKVDEKYRERGAATEWLKYSNELEEILEEMELYEMRFE